LKRPYISKTLINKIRTKAKERCGYCQAPPHLLAVKLEIEHIIPLAHGGNSTEKKLWLSCPSCNLYKGSKIKAIDPQSNKQVSLYNPRNQKRSDHFKWSKDGTEIVGVTPIGRATVIALRMNNELSVAARRFWVLLGEFPPG